MLVLHGNCSCDVAVLGMFVFCFLFVCLSMIMQMLTIVSMFTCSCTGGMTNRDRVTTGQRHFEEPFCAINDIHYLYQLCCQ